MLIEDIYNALSDAKEPLSFQDIAHILGVDIKNVRWTMRKLRQGKHVIVYKPNGVKSSLFTANKDKPYIATEHARNISKARMKIEAEKKGHVRKPRKVKTQAKTDATAQFKAAMDNAMNAFDELMNAFVAVSDNLVSNEDKAFLERAKKVRGML